MDERIRLPGTGQREAAVLIAAMPPRHRLLLNARLPKDNLTGKSKSPTSPCNETKGRMFVTPDASRWRSAASYDHVETLSASHLAWEWLRRNEAYDQDFEALAHSDADPQPLADKIRRRWGLRFPVRSARGSALSARLLAAARRHERRRPRVRAGRSDFGYGRRPSPRACDLADRRRRLTQPL